MNHIIAIDPGVHQSWCVRFVYGSIVDAWMQNSTLPIPNAPLYTIHCECPFVYPVPAGSKRRADPNDLIDLAVAVGTITALNKRKLYTPRAWKGNIPKKVHQARGVKKLTVGEMEILDAVCTKHLRHNIYDAALLGCFALGR